ncbi:hypothetical protein GF373_11720 [bacterium]|nr:hypothetical protein [bacterium]
MSIFKKYCISTAMVALLVFLGIAAVPAQESTLKIGFVDMDEVFDKSPKFQKVLAEIKSKFDQSKESLAKKQEQLKEEFEDFKLRREYMPKENVEEKQMQLVQERNQLLKATELEQKRFEQERQELVKPLYEEMQTVIESLAKEEGYAFIFRRSDMLYANPKYSLTEKVIERLGE